MPSLDAHTRSLTLEVLKSVKTRWEIRLKNLVALGIACALFLQLSEHRNSLHWITTGLVLFTTGFAAVAEGLRRGRETPDWQLTTIGVLFALSALCALAYLGVLSSIAVLLAGLVLIYSTGATRVPALSVYATTSLGYAVLLVLSGFGVIPLTGSVLALTRENPRALLGLGVMLEAVLVALYSMGRKRRASLTDSIDRVDRAQEEIHRREALLEEARAELGSLVDRPNAGLFTGRPVGSYVAQEVIGRGGMAEVYRAVAEGYAEPVALKVLNPSALENPDHIERFLREAKVSSELASDHIVRVLDSGVSADGFPFLAMELLEGSNLARFLRQHNRLPVADVVDLVEQLAQALSVAQRAGIVHRDLKPQNVFRTEQAGHAHWKLLDFGASKLQAISATLTHGAAIGTPSYMSPEQVRGDEVDHRADVFSLGSIAYRALTGQPAFSGPDPMSIMYQVHNAQPIRPSALVELPADVDFALGLALAKDPKRRLASAPDFARALGDAAQGKLSKDLRARALTLEADYPWRPAVVAQSLDQ